MRSVMALAIGMLAAPLAAADPIDGVWTTADKSGQVRVSDCGTARCGRLAKFLVAPPNGADQRDTNNPDRALRTRRLLGLAILTGFRPDGAVWRGMIYDPKSGKSYRSIVRRLDAARLEVKGCVGPFCQTQIWRRAD